MIAACGQIGQRAGQFGKGLFGCRQRHFCRRKAVVDTAQLRRARLRFGLERLLLGVEPLQRGGGIGGECALALQIAGILREPSVEFGDPLLGQGFFALERVAGDEQALQGGCGPGFGFAQGRQLGGDFGLPGGGDRLLAGAFGNHADCLVLGALGLGGFELGGGPAQMQQQRLGAPHLAGNVAIAHRLPGLGLERGDLGRELADHVLDPRQIVLGGFQPQLSLVPAHMQSGNAGGFFEQPAALIRTRLDDLADASLVHQRRRARAGRRVGEQHVDVARAHLAAVDPEGRALLAHDPARDFQGVVFVERGRRRVVGVVDHDADFGVVARRPSAVAGENHVVHLGGAHRLVGGFAHDPAHGFDQIGFAAAVRADHAGQSGFDIEVGRFNEGFESDQTQPRELHSLVLSILPAAAGEGIHRRLKPLRARTRRRCRIGAENKSSGRGAQQRRSVIQIFRQGWRKAADVSAGGSGGRRQSQKALILP